MKYIHVPSQITIADIRTKRFSLSPSTYQSVPIPNSNTKKLSECLLQAKPFLKGVEPGSLAYIKRSTHYLIRTRALQPYSNLICPHGDAIVPLNPNHFVDLGLSDGDIVMSKDSNIGECCMVDGDKWAITCSAEAL